MGENSSFLDYIIKDQSDYDKHEFLIVQMIRRVEVWKGHYLF